MRPLALLVLSLVLITSCAASIQVNWTNPAFTAPGPGLCTFSSDSCLDLAYSRIRWRKLGDSTWLYLPDRPARPARPDSVAFTVPDKDATYEIEAAPLDSFLNLGCWSRISKRVNVQPPSPAGALR